MKEFLVIDVGNTNVKYAQVKGGQVNPRRIQRHPTGQTASLCEEFLARFDADIAMACVVPSAGEIVKQHARGRNVIEVTATGQHVLTGMPESMGADRVADALAAYTLYGKRRRPVIVMGLGSATTLLSVDADGTIHKKNGWIAPGLGMSLDSLGRLALLPQLKMEGRSTRLGHDTETQCRNGTLIGYLGMVRELLAQAKKQTGGRPVTVATGGWCKLVQTTARSLGYPNIFDQVDPLLTLRGIHIFAAR